MSDDAGREDSRNLIERLPSWSIYVVLVISSLGGLGGGSSVLLPYIAPSPAEKLERRVEDLEREVSATAEAADKLAEVVNAHMTTDAKRNVRVTDHGRRIEALEVRQDAVRQRLDQIRVNQLVICRTLQAPCGD